MRVISEELKIGKDEISLEEKEGGKIRKEKEEDMRLEKEKEVKKDEYIREKEKEPSGLYRVIVDKDGNKKILYEKRDESENIKEKMYVNTDAVDREMKALKKKKSELLREIASFHEMGSEEKLKKLKSQLEQVEQELIQKDNDGYRRQRASFRKEMVEGKG